MRIDDGDSIMQSAAPPDAGGGRRPPPMLALPHGLVVVGDEAVQRAVVRRLGENYRATVCSAINAAVEMLRQRMKEFDFMIVSDALIRSSRPEIMKFLREETGLRLLVLRNEGGNEYSFKAMPNSRTEEEGQLEPVRPSTANREISHASSSRLPAASPYGDSNGSTATMVVAPAATAAAMASSVKRATNGRKRRRRAEQVISTQGQDVGEQSAQHRPRKRRFIWTDDLKKIFVEVYEELLFTENLVPTKILKLMKLRIGPMNDQELTRDTVSSYLQKYKKNQNLLKQKQECQHLPVDDNTNTSSIQIQQGSASLQQQIMHYGEYDSMNNQSPILSEPHYNEHSNMHNQHKSINMQPSNVVWPPNLINANEVNMSFNNEGVNEAIYQIQLTAHRVSTNRAVATAQASWRVPMMQDMHPISQVHQHDCETTPVDSFYSTNGRSENNNYHVEEELWSRYY